MSPGAAAETQSGPWAASSGSSGEADAPEGAACVALQAPHPLVGTVFYDEFKDSGAPRIRSSRSAAAAAGRPGIGRRGGGRVSLGPLVE